MAPLLVDPCAYLNFHHPGGRCPGRSGHGFARMGRIRFPIRSAS